MHEKYAILKNKRVFSSVTQQYKCFGKIAAHRFNQLNNEINHILIMTEEKKKICKN